MLLTPRYGPTPIIVLDGDPAAVAEPAIRQRRRFLTMIEQLTDDEWVHPSRCEGWSARDVAVHLASTNAFWELSIRSGIDGVPTEMLSAFDPVATPAGMVEASTLTTDEIVESFATSSASLADLLLELDAADWTAQAEAPPGHVSVSAVAHHALWDAWIHERDIALPLGHAAVVEPDEVIAALRYVAALTPALALAGGTTGAGGFDVAVSGPGCQLSRRRVRGRGRHHRDVGVRLRAHRRRRRSARSIELPLPARTDDSEGARVGLRRIGRGLRPLSSEGAGVWPLRRVASPVLCS